MKSLLIIRHAKSSWGDLSVKDFDRTLNDRGRKDAPAMAKRIHKEKEVKLDAIISSTAKRALATARFFAEEFNIKKKFFVETDALYEAAVRTFFTTVAELEDAFTDVALFSHNPGVTAFANSLVNVQIDDMPTCAVFGIRIKTATWKDFEKAEKEFWFFDYPKNNS